MEEEKTVEQHEETPVVEDEEEVVHESVENEVPDETPALDDGPDTPDSHDLVDDKSEHESSSVPHSEPASEAEDNADVEEAEELDEWAEAVKPEEPEADAAEEDIGESPAVLKVDELDEPEEAVKDDEQDHQAEDDEQDEQDHQEEPEEPGQPEEQGVEDESFEDESTAKPLPRKEPVDEVDDIPSRRQSVASQSQRKTSLRTEALIHAAARAVVAKIEKRRSSEHNGSDGQIEDDHFDGEGISSGDHSILSTSSRESEGANWVAHDDGEDSITSSRRESTESQIHHAEAARSVSGDEGGDSSSHHEADDDDVFSDRSGRQSGRSSLGSFDDNGHPDNCPASEHGDKNIEVQEEEDEERTIPESPTSHRDSISVRSSHERSPRVVSGVSGISLISGLSQYEREEFHPTLHTTPRQPFCSPSAFHSANSRAMQVTSPTLSTFSQASIQTREPMPSISRTPRSSDRRRNTGNNSTVFPTISRLGSPTVSAQYSPKGRSTPPRFKSKKDAPLVLLHVTLLPLRWPWGEVMNGLEQLIPSSPIKGLPSPSGAPGEKTNGLSAGEEPISEQLKSLRDAWRELHDRCGDTVLERGILLPHPQNDYEVLEERLLEALELPLRRRARILECGHYLGPSNMMELEDEEDESESEYEHTTRHDKANTNRHWCPTCKHDIKYEALGPGRIFRVKVYASNGLMKAGAWEACWKEMERVDVEIEPILETGLQGELERLADRLHQQQQSDQADIPRASIEEETVLHSDAIEPALDSSFLSPDVRGFSHTPLLSSPPPPAMHASPIAPPSSSIVPVAGMPVSMPVHVHPHVSAIPLPMPMRPHSSATNHSEPIDTSDARKRRDAERMREIYGDTPPLGPAPPEPTSSMRPEPTTSRPSHPQSHANPATHDCDRDTDARDQTGRHPDSYIPPPSPRSPSEEAYERRARRGSSGHRAPRGAHGRGEASLGELLAEVARVLMRDPKNVAIVVLAVFLVFVMARPGAQTVPVEGGVYRPEGKVEAEVVARQMNTAVPVVPVVEAGAEAVVSHVPAVEAVVSPVPVVAVESSAQAPSYTAPTPSMETIPQAASASTHPCEIFTTTQVVYCPYFPRDFANHDGLSAQQEVVAAKAGTGKEADVQVKAPKAEKFEAVAQEVETLVETETERKTMRLVETVTETVKVRVTATATATEVETETVTEVVARVEETPSPVHEEEVPVVSAAVEEAVSPVVEEDAARSAKVPETTEDDVTVGSSQLPRVDDSAPVEVLDESVLEEVLGEDAMGHEGIPAHDEI